MFYCVRLQCYFFCIYFQQFTRITHQNVLQTIHCMSIKEWSFWNIHVNKCRKNNTGKLTYNAVNMMGSLQSVIQNLFELCPIVSCKFSLLPATRRQAKPSSRWVHGRQLSGAQWGEQHVNSYSASRDNWCTVGGDGGCRVGEVRAGTTSPMPDHKCFKLQ